MKGNNNGNSQNKPIFPNRLLHLRLVWCLMFHIIGALCHKL